MSRLFVDLDGVLADFDGHYLRHFGVALDRNARPEPADLWDNITTRPNWFMELEPLPGAHALWKILARYQPTILSGVSEKIPHVHEQKRFWVNQYLGVDVPLITCKSKSKRLHGLPGDVLVDDWTAYRDRWVSMGGVFVLHNPRDPLATVEVVRDILGPPPGRK